MGSQIRIFRERVRDNLTAPPPTADADIDIATAVDLLRSSRESGLVLLDGDRRPVGLLTEADIARRVALRASASDPVASVMTRDVRTVALDEFLYRAIARMRRYGLRHLPAVDEAGRLAGMLHLDDALQAASEDLVARIDHLSGAARSEDDRPDLKTVKAAEVDVAADLLADNVPATEVLALITDVNNDMYRRVTRAILDEMGGDPPAGFAVLVMGSGGRGENFLSPDQDNGLVLTDYPDAEHDRIDGWFLEFADRLTVRMDEIGFPLCKGNVMATNPLWRKTQSQWREQLAIWMRKRSAAAVFLSDIFFDFRVVAGNPDLAVPLREQITQGMARNPPFLRDMLDAHEGQRSPLGLFGRFRTDPERRGAIHLKHYGTQPLIASVRLLALKAGIPRVATLDRIDALADGGVFDADERDETRAAFSFVCDLLLRSQISDFQSGREVTNFVELGGLRPAQKRDLRDAFHTIDTLCDRVRADLTGDVF